MQIIEIKAQHNGAHANQTINMDFIEIPKGYAVIPDDMQIPDTFPFVDIEVEDSVVVSMKARAVPDEPEHVPEPTEFEKIYAKMDYMSMMMDIELPD